jgi:hypothetical protein
MKRWEFLVMIVSFSAIYNEDGEVSGYLGMGKISAEKKIELSLIKTSKLLDEAEGISKNWKLAIEICY